MRSIEKLIRDELVAFLSLPERSYYQDDHAELLRMLEAEQWIKDNEWKRACDVFTDYGLTAELCQFIDEFRLWSYEVHGIRADWFYDNYETELPTDDYLRVFGFASPLVLRLEPMLNRCRRIVARIDELHAKMEPAESVKAKSEATPQTKIPAKFRSKAMSKKEAAKLLGRPSEDSAVKWLNNCIEDGTITAEQLTRQSFIFDIRQFHESTHAKMLPK
jgi:hypothetical protein